jgi:hypothetical protein
MRYKYAPVNSGDEPHPLINPLLLGKGIKGGWVG